MSKILNQYTKLKEENSDSIYLFRSGIFYIAIDDDARLLNEKLKLKITDFGSNSIKCGFPIKKIENYKTYFKNLSINYKFIDDLPKDININDYINNIEMRKILKEINDININRINSIEALNILNNIQQRLKKL